MSDLDDLLHGDVAGTAARAVTPPDFDVVAGRGRRLRARRRTALGSGLVVVALAGTAALAGIAAGRSSAPAPAVPSPTVSPSRGSSPTQPAGPSPEQIVDAAGAAVSQVAAFPEDPEVRAVVWRQCASPACDDNHVAIAVTGDGFRTRAVVGVRPDGGFPWLAPAGRDAFVVSYDEKHPYLLRTDGRHIAIARPGPPASFGTDEVLARWRGYGDDFIGVDPATGASHRIATPPGTFELKPAGRGGLQGIRRDPSGASAVIWSDDGGSSWQTHPLEAAETSLFAVVPTAVSGSHAVIEGADGATLFPFVAVQRSRGGTAWERFVEADDPRAYVGASAVLPDGRLVVDVVGWSDARAGKPGSRPRGPYVSAGGDWSSIERLLPGPESGLDGDERNRLADAELEVRGVSVGLEHATLYVGPAGQSDTVYAVDDSVATWTRVSVR